MKKKKKICNFCYSQSVYGATHPRLRRNQRQKKGKGKKNEKYRSSRRKRYSK